MKHARKDYDRIQDPSNLIPEDEPVMLFRAQDMYAPDALKAYAEHIRHDMQATPEALAVADRVMEWAHQMEQYALNHIAKSPDL